MNWLFRIVKIIFKDLKKLKMESEVIKVFLAWNLHF